MISPPVLVEPVSGPKPYALRTAADAVGVVDRVADDPGRSWEDKLAAYRRLVDDLPVDYVGFTVPDEFFVGYGFDVDGRWRNLPDLRLAKV
jgi:hypothetical protein